MQLKQTVWEELSIWENVNDISDFAYSDAEEDEIKETVDCENIVNTTKAAISAKQSELETINSCKSCTESGWDIDSCFGSPGLNIDLTVRIHTKNRTIHGQVVKRNASSNLGGEEKQCQGYS